MTTSAKIIADSISPTGQRITTMEVTFHRFILAELNTHRVFSRNSASSRAIPLKKTLERVRTNPASPVEFGVNEKGMQARSVLEGDDYNQAKHTWLELRNHARNAAHHLSEDLNVHKQIANRLLEPWLWHTAIITSTDYDNFFWQRCHPDAQPEMKALADAMQVAYYRSEPELVLCGTWHTPYVTDEDVAELRKVATDGWNLIELRKHVSVARCARVSFLNHDGARDVYSDLQLFDKLKIGMHWSPFEHVATPCEHISAEGKLFRVHDDETLTEEPYKNLRMLCTYTGNFSGWDQFRKFFPQENRVRFVPNLSELSDVKERMVSNGTA